MPFRLLRLAPEGAIDRADEVALSSKGAKSRTRIHDVRSTGTNTRMTLTSCVHATPSWKRSSPRRWSSRRRPRRCCKSSAVRRASWNPYSGHAGERNAHLRSEVRDNVSPRRRCLPRRCMHNAPPAYAEARKREPAPTAPDAPSVASPSRNRWSTSPTSRRRGPTSSGIHLSSCRRPRRFSDGGRRPDAQGQ